eukprot:TRINITY_DN15517_c0_g1_i1.p2 TRINITY_DN15517_c0_g1~~TRINITY_DN15517_c0_g1_i1.p2  ORF type:complete len:207 (-),score=25.13 TRINITY_DN15517_c0_g1_i1:376-921(-)
MQLGVDVADAGARNPEKTLFSGALEEHAMWLRKYVMLVDRVQKGVPGSVACGSGVHAVRRLQREEDGCNDSPGVQQLQPEPRTRPAGRDGGRGRSVKPEPRPLAVDVPKRRSAKPEPRAKPGESSSSNAPMVRVSELPSMTPELGTRPGNVSHRSVEPVEGANAGVGVEVVAQVEVTPLHM